MYTPLFVSISVSFCLFIYLSSSICPSIKIKPTWIYIDNSISNVEPRVHSSIPFACLLALSDSGKYDFIIHHVFTYLLLSSIQVNSF